jgi:CheY-like chemotaxis protein
MTTATIDPLDLFYSYSHRDEPMRDELATHLAMLERKGVIRSWHDRKISAGDNWKGKIDENLERADIVLLLVSNNFLASDYCYDVEMKRALARHEKGEARTVPVIIGACDWELADFAQMNIQALPKDAKPVETWPIRNEAWTDIAKGIRKVATELAARQPSGAPAAPPRENEGPRHPVEEARPAHGIAPTPSVATPQTPPVDPHFARALLDFEVGMLKACEQRGTFDLSASQKKSMSADTQALATAPAQKRILWVDDNPDGNQLEYAAFFGLQIEIVTARSTEEALATIKQDREGFDVVISDWNRIPTKDPKLPEGLRLAQELSAMDPHLALVFYHGVVPAEEQASRQQQAVAAGAVAATSHPAELVRLVTRALAA